MSMQNLFDGIVSRYNEYIKDYKPDYNCVGLMLDMSGNIWHITVPFDTGIVVYTENKSIPLSYSRFEDFHTAFVNSFPGKILALHWYR